MLGVALNLAVLGLFKYADFFRGTVDALLGEHFHPWDLILPLGISFFVFQKISYLIDLRRGDRHIYGFLDFCMFVTFFPQLIAGPIVRHNEIIHQFRLDPRRPAMWENLSRGFVLFVIGVAKKVALADTLAMVADPLFGKAVGASLSAAEAWIATAAYTLQIYFDFSGYSDMAIGLALMFGFRLPLNFNAPYRAVSVRDFWRRWHMTLSPLPARLSLHSARRQPLRPAAPGGERRRHHAARRPVAWRELDLRRLGRTAWRRAGGEPCLAGQGASPAARRRVGADAAVRHGLLGAVPLGRLRHRRATCCCRWSGGTASVRISLDREFVAALIGGAAIALLGPTSQEIALEKLQPKAWLAMPAGVGAGVSAAAGRRTVAECLHLLPVLTRAWPGAASSASPPARRCWWSRRSMPSSCWWIRSTRCRCRRRPIACRWRATRALPSRRWRARTGSTARSSAPRPAGCCGPVALNAEFGARFANLAMNAATAYEQSRLMAVFRSRASCARVVLVGLDLS